MRRRVAILTEAQLATLNRAALFVNDSNDSGQGEGDVPDAWARSNEIARRALVDAPTVEINKLHDAIGRVMSAAIDNSCSCPGPDSATGIDSSGPMHRPSGHARDCWNASHYRELERVRVLLELLRAHRG